MAQAVQSAAAGPQEPVFFYRPLSPSVVGGAPLSLVTWFVLQHMPEKAKWHLQLDGSTTEWPVTFCRDEGVGKRAFRGQLSGGWPRFAKENDLKATDWLKFTLIGPRKLRVMRLAGKPADWKPPHDSHSEKAGSKRPLTLTSPENGRGKPPGQALKRQKVAAPEAAAPNGLPVQAPDEQQRAAAPAGIAAARTTRDPRRQPLATMPVPRKPGSSAADASASASADQALRTAQQEAQEARQAAERARLQEKMQRKARSLNRPSLQPGKGSRTALTSDLHASPTPSASLGRLNSQSPSSAQGVMAQSLPASGHGAQHRQWSSPYDFPEDDAQLDQLASDSAPCDEQALDAHVPQRVQQPRAQPSMFRWWVQNGDVDDHQSARSRKAVRLDPQTDEDRAAWAAERQQRLQQQIQKLSAWKAAHAQPEQLTLKPPVASAQLPTGGGGPSGAQQAQQAQGQVLPQRQDLEEEGWELGALQPQAVQPVTPLARRRIMQRTPPEAEVVHEQEAAKPAEQQQQPPSCEQRPASNGSQAEEDTSVSAGAAAALEPACEDAHVVETASTAGGGGKGTADAPAAIISSTFDGVGLPLPTNGNSMTDHATAAAAAAAANAELPAPTMRRFRRLSGALDIPLLNAAPAEVILDVAPAANNPTASSMFTAGPIPLAQALQQATLNPEQAAATPTAVVTALGPDSGTAAQPQPSPALSNAAAAMASAAAEPGSLERFRMQVAAAQMQAAAAGHPEAPSPEARPAGDMADVQMADVAVGPMSAAPAALQELVAASASATAMGDISIPAQQAQELWFWAEVGKRATQQLQRHVQQEGSSGAPLSFQQAAVVIWQDKLVETLRLGTAAETGGHGDPQPTVADPPANPRHAVQLAAIEQPVDGAPDEPEAAEQSGPESDQPTSTSQEADTYSESLITLINSGGATLSDIVALEELASEHAQQYFQSISVQPAADAMGPQDTCQADAAGVDGAPADAEQDVDAVGPQGASQADAGADADAAGPQDASPAATAMADQQLQPGPTAPQQTRVASAEQGQPVGGDAGSQSGVSANGNRDAASVPVQAGAPQPSHGPAAIANAAAANDDYMDLPGFQLKELMHAPVAFMTSEVNGVGEQSQGMSIHDHAETLLQLRTSPQRLEPAPIGV